MSARGYLSFQAPEKIRQVPATWLAPGSRAAPDKIAHEADRDPQDGKSRLAISHDDAHQTIDRIEQVAVAIAGVIGPPPPLSPRQPPPQP